VRARRGGFFSDAVLRTPLIKPLLLPEEERELEAEPKIALGTSTLARLSLSLLGL